MKTLTMQQIERQSSKEPIWVINTSATNRRTNKITGEVLLSFPIANGQVENIPLPATWLPFNLTDRVPRKFLLASTTLRRNYQAKLIDFVTPEYAQTLLEVEGADAERAELEKRESDLYEAGSATTLSETPVGILMGKDAKNVSNIHALAGMFDKSGKVKKEAQADYRTKVAPRIPDYEDEEETEATAAVVDTNEVGVGITSSQFQLWVRGIDRKDDIGTLNSLRSSGSTFTLEDLKFLVASGKLNNKPKTLAIVKRNLK